jgi:hypothetical protein
MNTHGPIPSSVQSFVEHEGFRICTQGYFPKESAPCSRRIPGGEAYCTTSVKGIEWTKLPDVPVIVRL